MHCLVFYIGQQRRRQSIEASIKTERQLYELMDRRFRLLLLATDGSIKAPALRVARSAYQNNQIN
jgi:hypothetical protein